MNILYAASAGDTITDAVAEVAEALFYPVLIAALLALLMVAWEIGRVAIEAWKRSQRPKTPFQQVARHAQGQAAAGDTAGAQATLTTYAYNDQMKRAAIGTLFATNPIDAQRAVIEYDLYVSKRLDRVRLLVRAGPALGLMGTLIPLAPALAALGKGQPSVLADELQTAFAITVVGVLVGLMAFGVALLRERYFTRDLTDLEYLREVRGDAAVLTPASVPQPSAAAPAHMSSADQPTAVSAATAGETVAAPTAPSPPTPAPTPTTPVPPAPAASATQPAAAPPAVPGLPPLPAEQPKKKFGIRKKTPKPQAAPPAFPPPPPAPQMPGNATPPIPAPPTDKSPSIPDAQPEPPEAPSGDSDKNDDA